MLKFIEILQWYRKCKLLKLFYTSHRVSEEKQNAHDQRKDPGYFWSEADLSSPVAVSAFRLTKPTAKLQKVIGTPPFFKPPIRLSATLAGTKQFKLNWRKSPQLSSTMAEGCFWAQTDYVFSKKDIPFQFCFYESRFDRPSCAGGQIYFLLGSNYNRKHRRAQANRIHHTQHWHIQYAFARNAPTIASDLLLKNAAAPSNNHLPSATVQKKTEADPRRAAIEKNWQKNEPFFLVQKQAHARFQDARSTKRCARNRGHYTADRLHTTSIQQSCKWGEFALTIRKCPYLADSLIAELIRCSAVEKVEKAFMIINGFINYSLWKSGRKGVLRTDN